jgi:hypothetical protein
MKLAAGPSVAILLLLTAAPASAYTRYKSMQGNGFFWKQRCVTLTIYPVGFTDIPPDQVSRAMAAAAATWSTPSQTCGYLGLQTTTSSDPTPRARYDAKNSLMFRTDRWCKDGSMNPDACYDSSALAITTVTAKADGHIVDADIEVNALTPDQGGLIQWATMDVGPANDRYDFQNALTHEMGHFIGLDHTCFDGAEEKRPLDNLGQPLPGCFAAPPAVADTTMFASATPSELKKRTLAPDDQLGLCEIYPPALDQGICPTDDADRGCACATSARAPRVVSPLLEAGLAAMLVALRRRRAGGGGGGGRKTGRS